MAWFFVFFFISGFCSILYEIVWLRLAMAQFGITSPLASIVLSMFMAGLGLGSWASGRLIRKYEARTIFPPLRFYALAELLIGASALLVPLQLALGRRLLENVSVSSSWAYYLSSGRWIAITLVPWCACMGATIPFAMWAIRVTYSHKSPRSFSYLYLANVLGAVEGAIVPLLLIETRGFHGTLRVGAELNGILALTAVMFSLRRSRKDRAGALRPTLSSAAYSLALLPGEAENLWFFFSHRFDQHGAGASVDSPVHSVSQHCCLRVCGNSGGLSEFDLSRLAGLPTLESQTSPGKSARLDASWDYLRSCP